MVYVYIDYTGEGTVARWRRASVAVRKRTGLSRYRLITRSRASTYLRRSRSRGQPLKTLRRFIFPLRSGCYRAKRERTASFYDFPVQPRPGSGRACLTCAIFGSLGTGWPPDPAPPRICGDCGAGVSLRIMEYFHSLPGLIYEERDPRILRFVGKSSFCAPLEEALPVQVDH